MPLPNFLKKASSFILGAQSGIPAPPFNEGEVVFCKNNVCVHPPTLLRQDCDVIHHPGYLTVSCHQGSDRNKPTLRLSWIPNTTLRKNPWAIEKRSNQLTGGEDQSDQLSTTSSRSGVSRDGATPNGDNTSNHSVPEFYQQISTESTESQCSVEIQHRLDSNNKLHAYSNHLNQGEKEPVADSSSIITEKSRDSEEVNYELSVRNVTDSVDCAKPVCNDAAQLDHCVQIERPQSLICRIEGSVLSGVSHEMIQDSVPGGPAISIEEIKRRNRDQVSPSPSLSSTSSLAIPLASMGYGTDDIPTWMSSPEMLALRHNLTFPESATASPVVRRTHRCRRFSVDLSQMRSLRLFFNDAACTCGQLVVASRESQYKILHFHHGGLDHLAKVLQEWNFLLHSPQPSVDDTLPYRHFMVCRPEVSQEELHPEEGLVAPVGQEAWLNLLNEEGQLEDDLILRKGIFFGGLEPKMRSTVWPFLLHCYTFQSTYLEREQIQAIRRQEYYEITRRRLEMEPESKLNFWRNIQCIIEKDVVRTDRGNPYFAGEDNPHIEDMKNILLNYAVYNPKFGYTQGMSDLLAPVLVEIKDECDAFWCFVGLMQKAIFVCTPTDNDMDRNLNYLRELIHLMVPHFYEHLERHADAMELLFCHRWILLCFKREFPEPVALRMWEACWANYLTDYFHLFLCLAIICVYSEDVIAQDLRTDEMLLHFSSLAMYMDGELILRKARGLLHQFRQMPRIPCTLGSLCQLCGPGMWDSTHAPVIECVGIHTVEPCPHPTAQLSA
ncbi:TBC1 domain family member 16 [Anabrus simplex]|uniref:TBC1 domain family member 16 n=1 Tax=Anabrus simplex TaxID=316456 RepID=UPI0035A28241